MVSQIVNHIGNMGLLEKRKTAFLCSSKTTSRNVIESFDWATYVPTDACILCSHESTSSLSLAYSALSLSVNS